MSSPILPAAAPPSVSPLSEAKPSPGKRRRPTKLFFGSVLVLVAGVVSALATMLALLGYGVSLAPESMFGLPHAATFESTLELLDLSGIAISQLVSGAGHGYLEVPKMYRDTWPALFMLAAAWVVVYALLFEAPRRWWSATRRSFGQLTRITSLQWKARWAAFAILVFLLCVPLLIVPFAFLMAAASAGIAALPIVGMSAGKSYIQEWVIEPERCLWSRTRDKLIEQASQQKAGDPVKVTSCIEVLKDGKSIARGRVVLMTSKAVVLFDPATGSVRRVPTSDSTIEVLSTL